MQNHLYKKKVIECLGPKTVTTKMTNIFDVGESEELADNVNNNRQEAQTSQPPG